LTDYYIAVGINYLGHENFAEKSFFWCTGDCKKFSKLPEHLGADCCALFDQIQCVFTGEFDKVIISPAGVSDFVYIDELLRAKIKLPECGITELDRLAHVVNSIDSDCQIVPRGACKKTPLQEVRRNEAFRGLKADQAFDICNYFHFRAPALKKNIELNARKEGVYNDDFLDNADEDIPKGSWSILKDTMGTVAVLRSKLWPGFYSFHKCNSSIYGGFYIGNGCKALDIPFMF